MGPHLAGEGTPTFVRLVSPGYVISALAGNSTRFVAPVALALSGLAGCQFGGARTDDVAEAGYGGPALPRYQALARDLGSDLTNGRVPSGDLRPYAWLIAASPAGPHPGRCRSVTPRVQHLGLFFRS